MTQAELEILIKFSKITSENLKSALHDYFVLGKSQKDAADENGVDKGLLSRRISSIKEILTIQDELSELTSNGQLIVDKSTVWCNSISMVNSLKGQTMKVLLINQYSKPLPNSAHFGVETGVHTVFMKELPVSGSAFRLNKQRYRCLQVRVEQLNHVENHDAVVMAVFLGNTYAPQDDEKDLLSEMPVSIGTNLELKVHYHPSGRRTLQRRNVGEQKFSDYMGILFGNTNEAEFYRAVAQELGNLMRDGVCVNYRDTALDEEITNQKPD